MMTTPTDTATLNRKLRRQAKLACWQGVIIAGLKRAANLKKYVVSGHLSIRAAKCRKLPASGQNGCPGAPGRAEVLESSSGLWLDRNTRG